MNKAKLIAKLERLANELGLDASERLHRIHKVWAARGIEIPGYFERGKLVRLLLCLLFVGVLAAAAGAQTRCGTERWPVKTLADPQGDAIFGAPATVATIAELSALPAPTRKELIEATSTRFPAEIRGGRKLVHAGVWGFKLETDSDIHIVLVDLKNPDDTMVTEIPNPACVPPKYKSYIAGVRASFIQAFGTPTPRMKRLSTPRPIQAEGPLFFDFIHGQTGVAKNGAELHPLLYWKSE